MSDEAVEKDSEDTIVDANDHGVEFADVCDVGWVDPGHDAIAFWVRDVVVRRGEGH